MELSALEPGARITQNITLVRQLGAGGMGAVWIADHAGLRTRVVVKFMLSALGSNTEAQIRFSREAAAAAQVKSPHVVQMLDHGYTDERVPFIVMEYLEGRTLGERLAAHGAPSASETATIVLQTAKALSRVHAAGLFHRDIKPDNIFLCEGDEEIFVKLLDFGIAKSQGKDALDGQTATGQVVGTPFYMSPEQVNAEKTIDARSDLWALAVVAFESFTGIRPFDGPSFGALAVAIVTTTPPKVSSFNRSLPAALDGWFDKALARDPANRFATAKEFSDGLRSAFGSVSTPTALTTSNPRLSDSDSGPRDLVDVSAKTERVPTPLGLDSTISQGLSHSAPALSRSEPSSRTIAELAPDSAPRPPSRSSRIGIALVAAGIGVAIAYGVMMKNHNAPMTSASASAPAAITPDAAQVSAFANEPLQSMSVASSVAPAISASASSQAIAVATSSALGTLAKTSSFGIRKPADVAKPVASVSAAIAPVPTSAAPGSATPITPRPRSSSDPLY